MGVLYQSNLATEDKQDAQITQFASVIAALNSLVAQENDPAVIAKLDLVIAALTPLATAANQATANLALAAIQSALSGVSTAALQSSGNASLASILSGLSVLSTAAKQDIANTLLTSIDAKIGSSTSVRSSVQQISTASAVMLAANPNRRGFLLYNDTGAKAYVALGSAASASDFSILLNANAGYESSQTVVFRGDITARWASGNTGFMRITELT